MIDDRGRYELEPQPGAAEPLPEIDIFHVRVREALIEPTELHERSPPDEHVARPQIPAGQVCGRALKRRPNSGFAGRLPLVHVTLVVNSSGEPGQPARIRDAVVVGERHPLATGGADPSVAVRSRPP